VRGASLSSPVGSSPTATITTLLNPIASIPITAAVAACSREQSLKTTLERIKACHPPPAEILVHIDGNHPAVRRLIVQTTPHARILATESLIGPGGARNRLTREAASPFVAHFDDDSFPADTSYFATAAQLIDAFPDIAVWCATITSHETLLAPGCFQLVAVYPGCGHLMNQSAFQRTLGYVERPIAYNLEEVDVSLQLHALGERCIQAADLHVWHEHPTPARELPEIETAMMVNTILFPLLRYPLLLFPQAALSILRRTLKLIWLPGGARILTRSMANLLTAWSDFHSKRKPVTASAALSWLRLRRNPIPIQLKSPAPEST